MKRIHNFKELIKVYGLSALCIVVGFYVAYQFAGPAPTKNITIATGGQDGAYYQFGLHYAQQFKKDGVELAVLETAGSLDNLSKLMNNNGKVHAALVQGGVGRPKDYPMIESLGSLYYEPLWLFHIKTVNLNVLGDLSGKRLALGHRDSGTYALASQLLAQNNVTHDTSKFLEISGDEGIDALTTGEADALFLVAGTHSETVMRLLENDEVVLYSFRRAAAYARNLKFLSEVVLPEGSVDLDRNIPDRDISLLAPAANLIVRNDLHPALMYLFMIAADGAHKQGGLLEQSGSFPSSKGVWFPLNKEAKRYYQSGPPFLMRLLPFWLATWLVRMFVMVIPLLTIVYPLLKVAPPMYNWRIRRKVHKIYQKLYRLESDLLESRQPFELKRMLRRLEALRQKAVSLHVPASYLESQYNLRRHIDLMQERLEHATLSQQASHVEVKGQTKP